jgi:hypothetical protein
VGGPSPNDGSIVDKPYNILRPFLPSVGGPSPNDGSIVDKPYNFLRPFLPSVHIDGGGWPHPFFTFDLWCSRDLPSSTIQHLLVFEYWAPNDGSYRVHRITSSVHSYLRWGVRPPTTGPLLTNRITSSVHSYLRSISTAGGGRLFLYFRFMMFERFTVSITLY